MATALKDTADCISEEEYLSGELVSETKHEYIDGQVYAMTGGTRNHARIMRNFLVAVSTCLKGTECEAFPSELKV
jgi:Uma2 family endonuclease